MYMYMCVCVCVWEWEWEREGREGREVVVVGGSVGEYVLVRMCVLVCVVRADSLRSVPQGTANVWRNRQRVALSTCSQTENG